jgi:UDP-hydrolysing UDP-N-acetyl-D-glucosamine 2-epimerase
MPKALKIAILTTARSDFGLIKPVIRHAANRFEVALLVAGSHFLTSRGQTILEVEREFGQHANVSIVPIDAMDDADTPTAQVKTLAATQLQATNWFDKNPCDLLLFLGDRWELWGVTLPAFLHGVPLAHISGGEVTEGVIDDCVRHSHTKLAALHFAATQQYARNISTMGEEDWRIAVVGECGLDSIHNADVASPEEVLAQFGVDLGRDSLLVTFHPSTLDFHTPVRAQIDSLLQGLKGFAGHQIIFTAPGVEQGAECILAAIREFTATCPNAVLVDHFGSRNYLAVMSRAKVVVGNSSSGLVEASSFGVPAVNIGDRQKNRLAAESVQHVGYSAGDIRAAIGRALTSDYQAFARACSNPYDPYRDGKNSLRIVDAIERALNEYSREQLCVKKFDTQIRPGDWNSLIRERK